MRTRRAKRETFTEAVPQIGPGRRLTARMRAVMGEAIGEQLLPVSEVARSYGVGWHTAHDAFVALADATLGECHPETTAPPTTRAAATAT